MNKSEEELTMSRRLEEEKRQMYFDPMTGEPVARKERRKTDGTYDAEDFRTKENLIPSVYGPPPVNREFDPQRNYTMPVYGPPPRKRGILAALASLFRR